METEVYVGNLDPTTTEKTLEAAFAAGGWNVRKVAILRDQRTERSRGFGFVRMGSEEEAEAAIAAMNGKEVDGRPLKVGTSKVSTGSRGGRGFGEEGGFRPGGKRKTGGAKARRRR